MITKHLQEFGKSKKFDKGVHDKLSDNQKINRFELPSVLLLRNKNDSIATYYEKWILYAIRSVFKYFLKPKLR